MTITARDKRALVLLGVAAVGFLIFRAARTDEVDPAVGPSDSVGLAESRLVRLRRVAASVPGKEQILKQAQAELASREKGLIQADTAMQAQAQVLQTLRKIARAQAPPVDIKGVELGQPRALGDAYGEVSVSVSMDCRIDQIVNILADLTAQPELLATSELRLGAAQGREKLIPARVTVSGVVSRKLIPEKKGPVSF